MKVGGSPTCRSRIKQEPLAWETEQEYHQGGWDDGTGAKRDLQAGRCDQPPSKGNVREDGAWESWEEGQGEMGCRMSLSPSLEVWLAVEQR